MDGRKRLEKRSPLLLLVLLFLLYLGFRFLGFGLALLVKMPLNLGLSCPYLVLVCITMRFYGPTPGLCAGFTSLATVLPSKLYPF